jgi:hypothetical protein
MDNFNLHTPIVVTYDTHCAIAKVIAKPKYSTNINTVCQPAAKKQRRT